MLKRLFLLVSSCGVLLAVSVLPVYAQIFRTIDGDVVENDRTYDYQYGQHLTGQIINIMLDSADDSYTGTGIHFFNDSANGTALHANMGKKIDFRGKEESWSNVVSSNGMGFFLTNMTETSTIANTEIRSLVTGIGAWENTKIILDNIRVISGHLGIDSQGYSHITNMDDDGTVKGPVYIEAQEDGAMAISSSWYSVVQLYQAEIKLSKTGRAMMISEGSTISLHDSKIISSGGNNLIEGGGINPGEDSMAKVKLDNVDLSEAKDQAILLQGFGSSLANGLLSLEVKCLNGTVFDGYTEIRYYGPDETGLNLNMELDKAGWNVTRDSSLYSLSLDGNSFLSFNSDGDSGFYSISANFVVLQGDSYMILGIDESEIQSLISSGEEFQLFNGDLEAYNLNNALLYNADKQFLLDYEQGVSGQGWFTLNGYAAIPEPSVSLFGLASLFLSLVYRRKNHTVN